MKHHFFLKHFFWVVFLCGHTIYAQRITNTDNLYSKIDHYLSTGVEQGFSGAITVIKDHTTIINKGYGFANKLTGSRNNPNTIFDIGSNTKQFTAIAILKLVELGHLQLDTPISTFFTTLPKDKQHITIHQLLTHTAGFTDTIGKDFDAIATDAFFEQLFKTPLIAAPGTKYAYSNVGYSTLGRIIELVSGKDYETFLHEHVFQPAGMTQTGYLKPQWNTKQQSHSYNRGIIEGPPSISKYQNDGSITWHLKANGGINSTQNDLILWYKALKNHQILSAASLETMCKPYALYPSGKTSYAYGWTVREIEHVGKRLAHNGSNGAYAHSLIWFPKIDLFIAYATNANSDEVEFLAYNIAKIVLDKTYQPSPIKNNVYAFIMDYVKQYPTQNSQQLFQQLQTNYTEKFSNARLLNTVGNLLLGFNTHLDWAVVLFEKNVDTYPNDGNLWDSLGDGYKANKQYQQAITSYQKAITLGYKESQDKLQQLKAQN